MILHMSPDTSCTGVLSLDSHLLGKCYILMMFETQLDYKSYNFLLHFRLRCIVLRPDPYRMGMIRKAENQPFMVGQKQFTPSAYHIAKRKNVYL